MKMLVILVAAALLLAGPALTSAQAAPTLILENAHYGWADVLRVDPVYNTSAPAAPEEECWEEQVPVEPAVGSEGNRKPNVGGVFGAIVGGLLGNRFGKGSGRVVATAAGAVAGAVVGSNLADTDDDNVEDNGEPQYTTQRRCRPLGDTPAPAPAQPKVIGYEVEYRYRGDVYTSRLRNDPGDRLRVRVNITPVE